MSGDRLIIGDNMGDVEQLIQAFEAGRAIPIRQYPDPILLAGCRTVEDLDPWGRAAEVMIRIMRQNDGHGLAAPQIGLPYRVFVLATAKAPVVAINPALVEAGRGSKEQVEGCLSLMGQRYRVARPRKVKVSWTEPSGRGVKAAFEGLTARAFLHELDHLSGVLINATGIQVPAR